MSGFIDPSAPDHERLDRLELLITEALADMPVTRAGLSPEAQQILADLTGRNEIRKARAQRRIARLMAEDPLDDSRIRSAAPSEERKKCGWCDGVGSSGRWSCECCNRAGIESTIRPAAPSEGVDRG